LPPLNDEPIRIVNNTDFAAKVQEREWAGNGTRNDPHVIENKRIEDPEFCISISDVTVHFMIRHCILRCFEPDQGIGIYLQNCTNGMVESCDVSAGLSGIELFLSHSFVIKNCRIFSPVFAVNMSGSHGNQILGSDIESDFFTVSVIGSNQTSICNNSIHGIDAGIVSQNSWNCIVRSNRVDVNSTGIDLQLESHEWKLVENNVSTRGGVGVRFSEYSSPNVIYGNRFSHVNGIHAIDNGEDNSWDDGISVGSWWSDYTGIGVYTIPGTAGSVDHYPHVLE